MSISTTRDGVASGAVYLSLEKSDALILADLLRYQAGISAGNSAPGHAALCRKFADGIGAALAGERTALDQLEQDDPDELNGREAQ